MRVLFVFGTRPEAVKLCPLVLAMQTHPAFEPRVCVTAQHRELLDTILEVFKVRPHHDLGVMRPGQTLAGLTARVIEALDPVLAEEKPGFVLVQGDTTTTFAAALASFYRGIPVGHVEAGLRTGSLAEPFPEELNRVLTTRLSALHFAPTARAAAQLRQERVPGDRIHVTGNTGIDALLLVVDQLERGVIAGYGGPLPPSGKSLVAMTAHRRESFGPGFEQICEAALRIAARGDIQIVYPVHPNPNVREVVQRRLRGAPGVTLLEPLDYVPFIDLMRRADVLLTDSGGVQEEGPALGKPVIVMRAVTERQEAVEAGCAELAGTDPERICSAVFAALEKRKTAPAGAPVDSPFGDGRACARILDAIITFQSK
ncbi:MAG: UDP-N-acetylglucosamine 2-epimerase (non-hydrolyzing) [Bryobacteraceae bacterium]|nr:UDP-N-acetylglucosamine 2-epimerase (non-hydrolyzing) [Bryobacteraceae bacterium]